jgi:hypothetical protein
VECFAQSLAVLQHQSELLDSEIPCQADIGLLRVDTYALKLKLQPSPLKLIEDLKKMLPKVLKERLLEIKEWLTKQIGSLKSNNSSIDDFVRQQNSLRNVEKSFLKIKDKLGVINSQYITLKGAKFDIKKEDDQLSLDVVQNIVLLI